VSAPPVLAEYPKAVVLVDGAHLALRPLGQEDAPARDALLGRLSPPDGTRLGTAAAIRVGAFDGTRLAALLMLDRVSGNDTARLDLLLDPAYRDRRLGTWMLLDAVHLAAGLGIVRLLATVPADEGAFGAALRRLDFVEAPATDAPPGAMLLAKTLHAGWTDF
jgi:GNAT superfamily N-acetyltransferase